MDLPASPSPSTDYAPLAPLAADRSALPVLLAGAATTAAALAAHHVLVGHGFNALGWHVNYVLPLGAIGVGLVASIGFGAAAWTGGHRITAKVLLGAAAVLVGGYFAGQYVEYRRLFPEGARGDGSSIGFWTYYELLARSMRFTGKRGTGGALGAWGLAVRALQVAGFVLGGLTIPLILKSRPYCATCGRYRKTQALALIAAGIPDKLFGNDKPERVAERTQKHDAAQAALQAILADAARGDGPAVSERLQREGPLSKAKEAGAANARIDLKLAHCDRCGDGELVATMITGQGKQVKQTPLTSQPIGPSVVEALRAIR